MLRQFNHENHIYDKVFIYKGQNIFKLINSELRSYDIEPDSDESINERDDDEESPALSKKVTLERQNS